MRGLSRMSRRLWQKLAVSAPLNACCLALRTGSVYVSCNVGHRGSAPQQPAVRHGAVCGSISCVVGILCSFVRPWPHAKGPWMTPLLGVPPLAARHRGSPVDRWSKALLLAARSAQLSTKANKDEAGRLTRAVPCFISPLDLARRSGVRAFFCVRQEPCRV